MYMDREVLNDVWRCWSILGSERVVHFGPWFWPCSHLMATFIVLALQAIWDHTFTDLEELHCLLTKHPRLVHLNDWVSGQCQYPCRSAIRHPIQPQLYAFLQLYDVVDHGHCQCCGIYMPCQGTGHQHPAITHISHCDCNTTWPDAGREMWPDGGYSTVNEGDACAKMDHNKGPAKSNVCKNNAGCNATTWSPG